MIGSFSYTRMRVRNNRLIIGIGACHQCLGQGTILPTWEEACGHCSGKGLIRYSRFDRVCHKCKGSRKQRKWSNEAVTCPRCKGMNSQRFERGQHGDSVHPRIVSRIPAKVYRLAFEPTEPQKKSLNVMSTLYCCGRSRRLHTDKLLKEERPIGAGSANISKKDGTLCLHFGIFVTPSTRILGVVFDEEDVAWIEEGNREARKKARRLRLEAKRCCPTCRRPLKD